MRCSSPRRSPKWADVMLCFFARLTKSASSAFVNGGRDHC